MVNMMKVSLEKLMSEITINEKVKGCLNLIMSCLGYEQNEKDELFEKFTKTSSVMGFFKKKK